MTAVDPLELAGWHLAIGELLSEELPGLATDALVRGVDSPSLRELAGQNPEDVRDSRELFVRTLEELNIATIDKPTAMHALVRYTAGAVVNGTMSAQAGARWLSDAANEIEDEGDLRIFIGLSMNLEDYPESVDAIENEIVMAASNLLQRSKLTQWVRLSASAERSPLTRIQGTTDRSLDVQPSDLPLGPALIAELSKWNNSFVRTMAGRPQAGGFDSELQAASFVKQGKEIATAMQDELGTTHHVEYGPEPTKPPGVKIATNFATRARRNLMRILRRR